MDKLRILEDVAAAWKEGAINYAVIHGLDDFPASIGRDLDILVAPGDAQRALELARRVLRAHRLNVVSPAPIWGPRLVGAASNGLDLLEVHLSTALVWRNVRLASRPEPLEQRGPFRIDAWASAAKRIIVPLLAGATNKLSLEPARLDLSPVEGELMVSRLPALLGKRLGGAVVSAILERDLGRMALLAPAMRRAAVTRSLLHFPLQSLGLVAKSILRRLKQPFAPCAPVVAVVGPDGAGKSTLLQEVARNRLIFTDVIIRHWRPGVLPSLARMVRPRAHPSAEPASVLPRRTPGRLQWLRLSYYAIDYVLGTWCKDRIDGSRQRLVLYDRCALDMSVDPVRFGLQGGCLARWMVRRLPGPDLVVLLTDNAEAIHARKPELEEHEINRQLEEWGELHRQGRVHAVLEVRGSPADMAQQLTGLIVQAFCRKNESHRAPVSNRERRSLPASTNSA